MSSLQSRVLAALMSGILAVIIAVGGFALAHKSSSVVSAQQRGLVVTVRSFTKSVGNGRWNLNVSCKSEEAATGGGGSIGTASSTTKAFLARSAPLSSSGGLNFSGSTLGGGWRVTVANESGQSLEATVYVLCLSRTL